MRMLNFRSMSKLIASVVFSMCVAASLWAQQKPFHGTIKALDYQQKVVTIASEEAGEVTAQYDGMTAFRWLAGAGPRYSKIAVSNFKAGDVVIFFTGSQDAQKRYHLVALISTSKIDPAKPPPTPTYPHRPIEAFAKTVSALRIPVSSELRLLTLL
jgi:hypothetical protein